MASEEIKRVITIEDDASGALSDIKSSAEGAAEGLDQVSVNLDSFKKAGEQFKEGLGDVSEGLDRIVPGSKNVIEGVTKMGKAFKALLKNPIGIVLTGVVTVLGTLVTAIKKNDRAMDALSKATKAFEPILKVFSDIIEKIATGIAKVVEGIGNWITKLFGLKSATADAELQQRLLNDQIERGKKINESAVDEYVNAYSKFAEVLRAYKEFGKEDPKRFLEQYKDAFGEIAKSSSTFQKNIEGLSEANIGKVFGDIERNAGSISDELFDATKDIIQLEDRITSLGNTLKASLNVDTGGLDELRRQRSKLRKQLEDLLKPNIEEGTIHQTDQQLKESKKILTEIEKLEEQMKKKRTDILAELQNALTTAASIAGKNSDSLWADMIRNWDGNINKLKSSVVNTINELLVNKIDVSSIISVDNNEISKSITDSISNLYVDKEGLPVIELPIDIDIQDEDIEIVNEKIDDTVKKIDVKPIKNPLDALFEISSEQLANLDQYSTAYFEKAKEVENIGWQIEEARLQREGYTNEQIEALRKEHNKRLEAIDKEQIVATLGNIQTYSDAISSLGSGLISIIEATTEEGEDSFEKTKGLQIAVATIDTLSGVMGAWTSALNSGIPAPYSFILGGIQSAAVLATGIANVAKIKNTKIGSGEVSSATPSAAAGATYNPTYTTNVTGQSDIDQLQQTIESGTSAVVSDTKVYITETDLENSRNARKVKVEEASW